ncbi:MAG: hypothetical protein RKH07_12705 [Gammaproteobacteria bacterium]
MSGVSIVRYLLANHSALTDVVPALRIRGGDLPQGLAMPAIAVNKIGGQQENNLAMDSPSYLVTQRIQVTVLAKNYDQVQSILPLVLSACPLSRGTINGHTCEGVIPDTEGPDLYDRELDLHSQTQDFMVSFIR